MIIRIEKVSFNKSKNVTKSWSKDYEDCNWTKWNDWILKTGTIIIFNFPRVGQIYYVMSENPTTKWNVNVYHVSTYPSASLLHKKFAEQVNLTACCSDDPSTVTIHQQEAQAAKCRAMLSQWTKLIWPHGWSDVRVSCGQCSADDDAHSRARLPSVSAPAGGPC